MSALKHWRQGIAMLPAEDERLAVAQQRAAALAPRIPRLVVRVVAVAPPDARVELDGAPASLDDLLAGIAADPGRHLLVLHVAGRPDTRSEGTLVEGRTTTITLSPAAPTPPPVVPTGGGRLRTAGFAVLGVGVAGAVVAGVTGGILVARNSAINDECPFAGTVRKCSPHGRDLINGAGPLNIANGIGWGVGIAGVAAGIAMVVLGRNAPTSITPAPIGGGGGLFLTHVF